jgi:nucleoside-diphosphate-sugar epimerase
MDELHVFGASGAVGSFLIEQLRAERLGVIAWLHRSTAPPAGRDDGIEWRRIDLWRDNDPSKAKTIISAGPLDAFASWVQRVDTPRLQQVIALSSMSIASKRDAANAGERALAARLQAAEDSLRQTCALRGIGCTLLRPCLIWGAAQDVSLTLLYRAARKYRILPVPFHAGGLRQPVHAEDVAAAVFAAQKNPHCMGVEIPLGGAEVLPVADMWKRVLACAGARYLPVPRWSISLASHALGARGAALRAALQRWDNDQMVDDRIAHALLPDWRPRGFAPQPTDFTLPPLANPASA